MKMTGQSEADLIRMWDKMIPKISVEKRKPGFRKSDAHGGPKVSACKGCHSTNNRVDIHAAHRGQILAKPDNKKPRKKISSKKAGMKNSKMPILSALNPGVIGAHCSQPEKKPMIAIRTNAGTATLTAAIQ